MAKRTRKRETAQERCDRHRRRSRFYHVYASVGEPPCSHCRKAIADKREAER